MAAFPIRSNPIPESIRDRPQPSGEEKKSSSDRTRTCDPGLMNPLLCQLSYAAFVSGEDNYPTGVDKEGSRWSGGKKVAGASAQKRPPRGEFMKLSGRQTGVGTRATGMVLRKA